MKNRLEPQPPFSSITLRQRSPGAAHRHTLLALVLVLVLSVALVHRANAQDAALEIPAAAPPTNIAEIVKPPIPPSKAELADSAFKKLDVGKKGYVSRDDVRELEGFGEIFDAIDNTDNTQSGQLNEAEFKRAWAQYSGNGS